MKENPPRELEYDTELLLQVSRFWQATLKAAAGIAVVGLGSAVVHPGGLGAVLIAAVSGFVLHWCHDRWQTVCAMQVDLDVLNQLDEAEGLR